MHHDTPQWLGPQAVSTKTNCPRLHETDAMPVICQYSSMLTKQKIRTAIPLQLRGLAMLLIFQHVHTHTCLRYGAMTPMSLAVTCPFL